MLCRKKGFAKEAKQYENRSSEEELASESNCIEWWEGKGRKIETKIILKRKCNRKTNELIQIFMQFEFSYFSCARIKI